MLGIKQEGDESNVFTGKIGDLEIDNTQLMNEFENKYLQKTNYVISDLGVVT